LFSSALREIYGLLARLLSIARLLQISWYATVEVFPALVVMMHLSARKLKADQFA